MREKINRVIRGITATERCPQIRWDEVVRIEALGTDALGAFEVSLTFTHADGTEATVSVHHKGYDDVLRLMLEKFPTIPPAWFEELSEQPWHVERVLHRQDGMSSCTR